jgi:hypothetical protein
VAEETGSIAEQLRHLLYDMADLRADGEPLRVFMHVGRLGGPIIHICPTRRGKLLRSWSATREDDVDELSIGKLTHIAVQTQIPMLSCLAPPTI